MEGRPRAEAGDKGVGGRLAPPRFLAFALVLLVAGAIAVPLLGWRHGVMAAFDAGAAVFLLSCWPLVAHEPAEMRQAARRNDANRAVLLAITFMMMLVILTVIASDLFQARTLQPGPIGLVVVTLVLAWSFSNAVYMLHYAHLFYGADETGKDCGGLRFPETEEPDYLDFAYFAFCLGMTFQTSDVDITSRRLRAVVTLHSLAAFVFNLGILAFTISVLSG